MLRIKENQCIVISGESGSGKTESTNFLLHHLTTLSQKGSTGSSVEKMLLSAGPVLEVSPNFLKKIKLFFRPHYDTLFRHLFVKRLIHEKTFFVVFDSTSKIQFIFIKKFRLLETQ